VVLLCRSLALTSCLFPFSTLSVVSNASSYIRSVRDACDVSCVISSFCRAEISSNAFSVPLISLAKIQNVLRGVYFIWSIVLSNPSNMELFSCSKICNCCSDNVDSNWRSASISLFRTFDGTPLSGLNLGGGRLTILKSNIFLQQCIPLTFLHFSH
jgi:hypothetical protein